MFNGQFDCVMNYSAERRTNEWVSPTKTKFWARNGYIISPALVMSESAGRSSVKLTIEYLGYIKQSIDVQQGEQIALNDGSLVRDLLMVLAEKHGTSFQKTVYEPNSVEMKPHYILSINGLLLNQLNGIDTELKDGDHVVFMPVVSGG